MSGSECVGLGLNVQDQYIRGLYPQFQRLPLAERNEALWRGVIRPTLDSARYTASVWYRLGDVPRVWVREVMLARHKRRPPHLYLDESLCLFWPRERPWRATDLIAHTILPWTSIWLGYYELWVDTDRWWGPEAPHGQAVNWARLLKKEAK
jgi:hypothetical protein